jgi:hypothetical protein
MYYFNSIYHSICEGGDANRQLIKLHFSSGSPIEAHFAATNMMTEDPMVFLMDCKVFQSHKVFHALYLTDSPCIGGIAISALLP